jgi:hypothetical protein
MTQMMPLLPQCCRDSSSGACAALPPSAPEPCVVAPLRLGAGGDGRALVAEGRVADTDHVGVCRRRRREHGSAHSRRHQHQSPAQEPPPPSKQRAPAGIRLQRGTAGPLFQL